MPRKTPRVPTGRIAAALAAREAEVQAQRPIARPLLTGQMAREAYGGRA